jgi:hypothetical protein
VTPTRFGLSAELPALAAGVYVENAKRVA